MRGNGGKHHSVNDRSATTTEVNGIDRTFSCIRSHSIRILARHVLKQAQWETNPRAPELVVIARGSKTRRRRRSKLDQGRDGSSLRQLALPANSW